ncbi:mechanosensitive ion channel domain-containing protein [Hoeflea sp.]|uniref:mechanosensitive ion channel domain-containing protein n=1 Tax=Hoeflea sp. TaxID=1940281 RepID=UPI003B528F9D
MRFHRLTAVLLAGLLFTCPVAPVHAQTDTDPGAPAASSSAGNAEQGQPPEQAPADEAATEGESSTPAVSPAIVLAEQNLAAAEADMTRLRERVEENSENDAELVDLKLESEALARSMLEIGVSLRPRLTEIKARSEQLGPPPGEGEPAEPEALAAERARLAEERAAINALTGRAETVSVRASETGDEISALRRDLFARTLFKRTEIGPGLMSEAMLALEEEVSQAQRTFGSWLRFIWSFKWQALMAWIFLSLLAALILIPGAYRLFGGLINRNPYDEDPPYTSRLSVAFWSTVIPSVAMAALAFIVYMLLDSLSLLRRDVAPVISAVLAALAGVYFVNKLARAILAPKMPAWRLVNLSNAGARLLFPLVVALVVVNALDFVLSSVSQTLNSPVVLTVAKGFVSVMIMALILIGMAAGKPMLAASGDPADSGQRWPRLISATLVIAGIGLIVTALFGYIGLSRFVATQIVVTGAILTTMYIGYISGKAISAPEAFAHTAVGRWLETRYGLGAVSLDQAGLAAGLLINLLVLMLGLPLILLQWGFQIQDIELWFYRLVTDIRIGGITISLVGIMVGVLLFMVGLVVTRWFQQWLDGSVMSRGRLDTGVRNSIKTGIGYLGVAIAGLIGVMAAGIDLSSLALVAGALSLGIGFGLQNIVSNFVSGLILLVERPFKVGDWVSTSTTEGFVKRISVRATEIETFTRQSIIVPNSELINSPVGNWTHRNKLGRVDVPIGVSYDTDPRRLVDLLTEIARGHELVLRNPEPVVHFSGFGESSLDFVLKCHVADVLDGITVRTELSIRVLERLREENIEIPFPQRDLNIKIGENGEALGVIAEKVAGAPAGPPKTARSKPAAGRQAGAGEPSKPARRSRRTKQKADSIEPDTGEGDR